MAGDEPEFFVINPLLLGHFASGEHGRCFVLQHSSDTESIEVNDWRVLKSLITLGRERFLESDAKQLWQKEGASFSWADECWAGLKEFNIVVRAESPVVQEFKQWERFNWHEAARYQFSTRDYPFLDMALFDAHERDRAIMDSYSAVEPPPSVFLNLPHQSRTLLDPLPSETSIDEFIAATNRSNDGSL